jgi:uncharacterized membrane protein YadS
MFGSESGRSSSRWSRRPAGKCSERGAETHLAEIWWRFPEIRAGFLAASVIITVATAGYSLADFNKIVNPAFVAPIKDLRTWAFIFCFLSIGLTTRFRELAAGGAKLFVAFSSGVAVNVVLGFVLSALVFASHWAALGGR